jgi:hypothetical protein
MNKKLRLNWFVLLIAVISFASCTNNGVKTISLDRTTLNLIIGQNDSLISTLTTTGDIAKFPQTWTSSNAGVASVKNGLITALSKGTTVITVKADDKTAACQVTVDDQITPSTTKALLVYYGDAYNTKIDSVLNNDTNNFILYFGSSNVDMNNYFTGDGERLILEFNTPLSAKDSLLSGTYDMMTELSLNKLLPFTLVPAYYDSNNNEWGCWYFNVLSGIGKSFSESSVGNVVVSHSQNVYTIKYYLIDYYGNTISGTYQGAISYYDGSSSSAPAAVKAGLKAIHRKVNSISHQLIRR